MEATLVLITLISIAAAIGLSVMGWSLLRNDKRRSDARVATLEALAFDEPELIAPSTPTRTLAPTARFATLDDAGFDSRGDSRFDSLEDSPADLLADAPVMPAIIARASHPMTPDAAMFAAADEHGAPRRRWVAVLAVAVLMAAGVGGAYSVFGPNARIAAAAGSVAPAAEGRSGNHPIALVSLKHDANVNGAFVVTGLVQNPADGQPLKRVEALVYLFDDQGNYFALGRAALEFTSLEPGEESPFVIKVPTTARVGRYRVGFRLEGGGAVAHVDKRGQAPATSPESGS